VLAYLVATNTALNYLEQRESVNLTLQVAIAVGALLALLAGADTFSGERERGTLETLLLTPVARVELTAGKLLAALSLWLGAYAITIPYVWFLGRGIGVTGVALATGALVGTLLAIFLASLGVLVSAFAASNRISLSFSLFVLLALFAPTQFPTSASQGWAGELFQRVDPITAGEHYVGKLVVDSHGWGEDASWLVSPVVAAIAFAGAVLISARRIRLRGGSDACLDHTRPHLRPYDDDREPRRSYSSACRTPQRAEPRAGRLCRPRGLVVAPHPLHRHDPGRRLSRDRLAGQGGQQRRDCRLRGGSPPERSRREADHEPDGARKHRRAQDAERGRDHPPRRGCATRTHARGAWGPAQAQKPLTARCTAA
jgi:ABC-2 type transport system permease protein